MSVYGTDLKELQRRAARKAQIGSQLRELEAQRRELEARVEELAAISHDEQADVDRLEAGGLTAFFYSLLGKGEEKLSKERREAAAAALKYEAAARELANAEDDLERLHAEYAELADAEEEYRRALEERAAELRRGGSAAGRELLRIEAEIAAEESRKKELLEAIAAGSDALNTVNVILDELGDAEGWATWDMFGGGMISDLAKHSHLDSAQHNVSLLQSQLRRFRTELADVGSAADGMQVSIDGFMRFADYFFDGFFVDWMVLDRIQQSTEQVQNAYARIHSVLDWLNKQLARANARADELRARADAVVADSQPRQLQ